ncbi:MAG: HNH endonuclease [Candidatus Xenobiia bacterium LiM19]
MKQCLNNDELTRNDTVSHTDGMDLVQGLSADEVHKRALAARKLYGKAEKALTFWIVEMDDRRLYSDFGCSSIFQYATRYLSLAEHTIAELLRTGKALAQLPLLSEAFEKGQISSSHVREISRVATEETDQFWCDTARGKTVREVEKLVAFTPKGGLPGVKSTELKPVSSAAIQPAHSMTTTIPVESAVLSAQTPAPVSEEVLKCISAGEALHEPGATPGMSRQREQNNVPGMSLQNEQGTVPEIPLQLQGSVKYHEKLVVDLDALQMSVLQDAFMKARKESGLKDRASLLVHIAKAFLEGCPSSGKRRKPRYQIVVHRHLPSGLAWCDTLKGERPVPTEVLEKALCDAEILALDELENPTGDRTGCPTGDRAGHPTGDRTGSPAGDRAGCPTGDRTDSPAGDRTGSPAGDRAGSPAGDRTGSPAGDRTGRPTGDRAGCPAGDRTGLPTGDRAGCPAADQSIEKEHNNGITSDAADRKEADIPGEANDYINEQYMKIKDARRKGHKQYKSTHRNIRKEGRAIPAPLRKKVLFRDICTCQAPGCGRKIFLTIHHLIAFALCGIHSISGLLTLCSKCHALVHEGKLSVEGEAPHRLIWHDGKGRVI